VFGASQPATTTSKFPSVGQAKGKPTFGSTFGQSKAAAESPNNPKPSPFGQSKAATNPKPCPFAAKTFPDWLESPNPNPFGQSKAVAAAESHALKPSIFERSKAAARSPSGVHADRQAVIAEARRAHAKQTTADGAADGLPSSPPPAAESPNPKPSIFGQSKAAAAPAASATSPRSPSGVKDDMTAAAIAEALMTKRAQAKQTTADGAGGGLLPTPRVGSDRAAEPPKPASIFGQSKGGAASAARPQAQAQPKISISLRKPAAVVSGAPTLSGVGGPSTATASGPVSPAGGGLKFAFGHSKGGFSSQAGVAAASTASPAQPKLSFSFGAKPGAGAAPKAADGSGDNGAADGGDDENSEDGDDDDEDDDDEDDEGDEDEDEEWEDDDDDEGNPECDGDSENDGGSEAGDGDGGGDDAPALQEPPPPERPAPPPAAAAAPAGRKIATARRKNKA